MLQVLFWDIGTMTIESVPHPFEIHPLLPIWNFVLTGRPKGSSNFLYRFTNPNNVQISVGGWVWGRRVLPWSYERIWGCVGEVRKLLSSEELKNPYAKMDHPLHNRAQKLALPCQSILTTFIGEVMWVSGPNVVPEIVAEVAYNWTDWLWPWMLALWSIESINNLFVQL